RLARTGLNDTIGSFLHKQRDDLPDLRAHNRRLRERAETIAQVRLDSYELEDEQDRFPAVEKELRSDIALLAEAAENVDECELEPMLDELLDARHQYYASLRGDYRNYFRKLLELDTRERELVQET